MKIKLLLASLCLFAGTAFAQQFQGGGGGGILYVAVAPSGACNAGVLDEQVITGAGGTYTCQTISAGVGTWTVLSSSAASGTVTSVTVAGTANQITASGTCTVSTTGTCTLSLPAAITLPGTLSLPGQLTSTLATGTAPFVVASTTVVANLNASQLLGQTWAVPGTIGGTTPGAGNFAGGSLTGTFTGGATFSGNLTLSGANNFTGASNTFTNTITGSISGNAGTATALAAYTGFSIYGSAASSGVFITPSANGQCLMSAAASFATTTPSFQTCPASFVLQVNAVSLSSGDTVNFNNTTPIAGANGVNVLFQTSKASTTDSISAELVGNGNSATFLNGAGTYTTPSGSAFTPQTLSSNNAVLTSINFLASTVNAAGWTITPSNPATTNQEKFEITGPLTTLGDVPYGGTGGAIARLAGPTGPNNVFQYFGNTPSGGAAAAESFVAPGVSGRAGVTSDTLVSTDCQPLRIAWTGTSASTLTAQTPGTLQIPFCSAKLVNNTTQTLIFTAPAGWTCSLGSGGVATSSCSILEGQNAVLFVDPITANNFALDIVEQGFTFTTTGSSGAATFTRSVTGPILNIPTLTAASIATLIQGLSGCSTGGNVFVPAGSNCVGAGGATFAGLNTTGANGTNTNANPISIAPGSALGGSTADFSVIGVSGDTNTAAVAKFSVPATTTQPLIDFSSGGNNVLFACNTGASNYTPILVAGAGIACGSLTTSQLSKFWAITATATHAGATIYDFAVGYTANLLQLHSHTAAGTGFNFLTACAGASGTDGSCASGNNVFALRGDGTVITGTWNAGAVTSSGAVTGATLVSTVSTGTAPLTVTSTTNVANLNASSVTGFTFGTPTAGGIAYGVSTTQYGTTGLGIVGQLVLSGGAGSPTFVDFPERFEIPAANCNNTTPGAGWNIGASGVIICRGGTNNLGGAVQITDTAATFAQTPMITIPVDWDTATRPYIKFYFSVVSDTTNGHTVIPQIKVSCPTAGNGTTTDDVTFSAAQSSSTFTIGASGLANGFVNSSSVQIGSTQMSGCIAGGVMIVQIGRATDTVTGNVNFWGVDLTFPRLVALQAN